MNEQEMITPGVSREGLAALLERYQLGPLKTVVPIDAPAGGLLINDTLVVRCDAQTSALRKEALIYRRLGKLPDVPCPTIVAFDTERDLLPCDALILEHVAGASGSAVWPELDVVQRQQISENLGRICGTIHSLRWSVYGGVIPDDPEVAQSGRWTDIVIQKAVRVYRQASQRELLPQRVLDAFITTINDGDAIFDTAEMPVLAHTDLGMWNVLLQKRESRWFIAAVVGWESAITADPAWDFAALWSAPINAYPLLDSFIYGYKEHHVPPIDLRIRQRLYRTIYHLEQALRLHGSRYREPETFGIHLTAIERLLTLH